MRRMQCNLESGCKTSISSGTEENHGQLEPAGRSQELSDAGLLLVNCST